MVMINNDIKVEQMSLDILPDELILHTAKYLNIKELFLFCGTNKYYGNLLAISKYWRCLVENEGYHTNDSMLLAEDFPITNELKDLLPVSRYVAFVGHGVRELVEHIRSSESLTKYKYSTTKLNSLSTQRWRDLGKSDTLVLPDLYIIGPDRISLADNYSIMLSRDIIELNDVWVTKYGLLKVNVTGCIDMSALLHKMSLSQWRCCLYRSSEDTLTFSYTHDYVYSVRTKTTLSHGDTPLNIMLREMKKGYRIRGYEHLTKDIINMPLMYMALIDIDDVCIKNYIPLIDIDDVCIKNYIPIQVHVQYNGYNFLKCMTVSARFKGKLIFHNPPYITTDDPRIIKFVDDLKLQCVAKGMIWSPDKVKCNGSKIHLLCNTFCTPKDTICIYHVMFQMVNLWSLERAQVVLVPTIYRIDLVD